MRSFIHAATGELHFGAGVVETLPRILRQRGLGCIILVISRSVFEDVDFRDGLFAGFNDEGILVRTYRYDLLPGESDPLTAPRGPYGEASPDVVDAVATLESDMSGIPDAPADAVVAIGGGSAVDTGKALSVALRQPGSIADYLEGVGTREPGPDKLPFIAVPTTAGTGTEATKNAVLARVGPRGFKKSLRHSAFVPDVAIVDPLLHLGCPREITAASGMDAVSQLLEAYLSTGASPLTEALSLDGLAAAGRSYVRAVERGETDVDARAGMAYAAYLSGICLANAGLGVVHGLAGPAGAHSSVPHGAFCAHLLLPAIEMLVERVVKRRDAVGVLGKLATAGRVLSGRGAGTLEANIQLLLDRLTEFRRVGGLTGLARFGFDPALASTVAAEGNSKAFPVQFDEDERLELLSSCISG